MPHKKHTLCAMYIIKTFIGRERKIFSTKDCAFTKFKTCTSWEGCPPKAAVLSISSLRPMVTWSKSETN